MTTHFTTRLTAPLPHPTSPQTKIEDTVDDDAVQVRPI